MEHNLLSADFNKVMLDVITIADKVDSQLKQAMASFDEPESSGLSLVAVNQFRKCCCQLPGACMRHSAINQFLESIVTVQN